MEAEGEVRQLESEGEQASPRDRARAVRGFMRGMESTGCGVCPMCGGR